MRVARWGKALAVRLRAALVRALGLRQGDHIELRPADDALSVSHRPRREEVLDERRRFRGRLPARERLSRDAANER